MKQKGQHIVDAELDETRKSRRYPRNKSQLDMDESVVEQMKVENETVQIQYNKMHGVKLSHFERRSEHLPRAADHQEHMKDQRGEYHPTVSPVEQPSRG